MSRINAIRIANLNYNNNAIHIDDELFELGQENTLFSLRNGGGKSVLVQMISAPFVRKRYRDTKDRPFESYFNGNKPTYIMVEWTLEGNNGYVLTGMMVRQNQENKDETTEPLETIQFVYEYEYRNEYDIYQFPLLSIGEEGKNLLSFSKAKKLFEELKRDSSYHFNSYDMNQPSQSRSYFEKIKEYQINHKEWESIIKKINIKESGLSELFSEAKDESGLVEKWFLPAVEDKLSKEEDRIDKFVLMIKKYVFQYKENQLNYAKKSTIERFKEETKLLLELANEYETKLEKKEATENKIANLILCLKNMLESLNARKKDYEVIIEQKKELIQQLECMELAYEIYQKQDEFQTQNEKMQACQNVIDTFVKEEEIQKKKIKQQECAKAYGEYKDASAQVEKYEEQLKVIREKNEGLAPERNQLGYSIACYYEEQLTQIREQIQENESELQTITVDLEKYSENIEQNNEKIQKYSEEKGTLKANVEAFDKEEQNFNARYNEKFSRNIVRVYEDGLLLKKNEQFKADVKEHELHYEQTNQQLEQTKKDMEEKEKERTTLQGMIAENRAQESKCQEIRKRLDALVSNRLLVLPYVSMQEEDVYETAKIVHAFEEKIRERKEKQKSVMLLEDKRSNELNQLKSGRVLELPKEIEEKLRYFDIDFIYGMEWLKRNGNTKEKNEKLIKENPFLPYAIIINEKDINKLKQTGLEIYTSFPIPIICREELEKTKLQSDHNLYQVGSIYYYIAFNQNLLDKVQLEQLIAKKEEELLNCREHLQQIESELNLYEDKKSLIVYDGLQQEEYKLNERQIKQLQEEFEKKTAALELISKEYKACQTKITLTIKTLETIGNSIKIAKEKCEAFENFCRQYEAYERDKERACVINNEIKQTRQENDEIKMSVSRLKRQEKDLRVRVESQKKDEIQLVQERKRFEAFTEGERLSCDISEMIARYEAITSEIHQEEKDVEKALSEQKLKKENANKELTILSQTYGMSEQEYMTIHYDMELLMEYKKQQGQFSESIKQKTEEKIQLSSKCASLKTEMKQKQLEYEKKALKKELIPREKIQEIDFKQAIYTEINEKKTKENELVMLNSEQNMCDNLLNNLLIYEEFEVKENLNYQLRPKEINQLKTEILKEYQNGLREVNDKKTEVLTELNRLLRIPEFTEDYYKKPLESLEKNIDVPKVILEQLTTTISAYEQMLLKLTVDLMMIEQEKEKVIEILLQYVKEVHENLGKIDRNSTITIREKEIKMLKILLPDWEEEKKTYDLKCRDYIEDLTNRALELLNENRNIEELITAYITTKNLYHQIVGMGNVGIRLYKVEEEREYPISWAEVSKNSGGEGFLSAFVILSSLLSYMRRDDTDIFNKKDSGKVLIMDNPFAQTNASHLLIPLMDIAKKTNTQLICLSGLGGESIYGRFDNIYVLNLVSSKIKDSMQYLHGNHIKGEDLISIISARVQVKEEQMVLF